MILPEFFDGCDECGEPFEPNTTYPVITPEDDDGTMRVYSFCDDECLSTWRHEASRETISDRDGDEAEV